MKMLKIMLFAVVFTTVLFAQTALAEDSIKTMAQIMINLNHFPSDSDKEVLRKITLDSATSQNEKTLASAMINLQHAASDADKQKLSAIIKDRAASENERNLAEIIYNLNHKPSSADKEQLKKMM